MISRIRIRFSQIALLAAIAVASAAALVASAQAPAQFLGTVTGISRTTISVKTDAGDTRQVDVPAEASLKRIAPGQKDLSTAVDMTFAEIATGDRVLVKVDPNATGPNAVALRIIAMKLADVAAKQAKEL